jgi:hypothetical protein
VASIAALAKGFRGRFLARARRALPDDVALPAAPKRWVVFAKPAVQGPERVPSYLGRYVHRSAITDRALVAADDNHVTFSYRDTRDQRRKHMSLPPHEFLRRFLQHVLPKRLNRVRAFGLLHPAHRVTLHRLQLALGQHDTPSDDDVAARPRLRCPHCKSAPLIIVRHLSAAECVAFIDGAASARAPPSLPIAP